MNERPEPDSGATLDDVARQVGVSTRTVSRVVRNEGGYSTKTEDRVRQAIAELGYYPNLLARGLSSGRSGAIGLVGISMKDPYFPELAHGIQAAAHEAGVTMFFATSDHDAERQRAVLGSLRSYGADGVIIFPATGTVASVSQFAAGGTPTVMIDADGLGPNLSSISSEIAHGAHLAVDHLIRSGRRKIAMLADHDTCEYRREESYRQRIQDSMTPLVERAAADAEGGGIAMRRLLERAPDLDAVFAYNDMMALGAIRTIITSGRSIPGDVAVVGFDDIHVSSTVVPALSTVRLDRERVGHEAVAMLMDMIENRGRPSVSLQLPVELIVRETS